MTIILELLFWGVFLLILHSYVLYPQIISDLAKKTKRRFKKESGSQPQISILISCYNEEDVIRETLDNFLELDYDKEKIEFVIGSDNSKDGTNDILNSFKERYPGFKVCLFENRRGKSHVLNDLVREATGEILVFSDANTIYDKNALKELVKYYVDPEVGGVSGKLILVDNEHDRTNHEASYWNFETWIKTNEGKLGTLIGANGGIYSIRKELYTNIPTQYPVMDDFFISLKVLEKGKYFLYEDKAIAVEETAPDTKIEFRRKIRNNAIDLSTLRAIKPLLKPSAGLAAFALWSHKLIRWFTPVLLIILFLLTLPLKQDSLFFSLFYWAQIIFYLSAAVGFVLSIFKIKLIPFSLTYYFVIINIGLLIGIIKYITGSQTAFWQSTKR